MTVHELRQILERANQEALVWFQTAEGSTPVEVVIASTATDPATGIMGGDKRNRPIVVLARFDIANNIERLIERDREAGLVGEVEFTRLSR